MARISVGKNRVSVVGFRPSCLITCYGKSTSGWTLLRGVVHLIENSGRVNQNIIKRAARVSGFDNKSVYSSYQSACWNSVGVLTACSEVVRNLCASSIVSWVNSRVVVFPDKVSVDEYAICVVYRNINRTSHWGSDDNKVTGDSYIFPVLCIGGIFGWPYPSCSWDNGGVTSICISSHNRVGSGYVYSGAVANKTFFKNSTR